MRGILYNLTTSCIVAHLNKLLCQLQLSGSYWGVKKVDGITSASDAEPDEVVRYWGGFQDSSGFLLFTQKIEFYS